MPFFGKDREADARCPQCACPDFVLTGKVFRSSESGVRREVGSVCRCARCLAEFYVGPDGVHRPNGTNGSIPDGPKPQVVEQRQSGPTLVDSDMPWSAKRR